MENLFVILLLLSIAAFGLGLVSPSIISKIFRRELNRKKVLIYFGGATVVFFILFGIFSDSSPTPATDSQQQAQNITEEQVIEEKNEQEGEVVVPVQPTSTPETVAPTTVAPQPQTQPTPTPQPQPTQSNCMQGQVDINSAPKEELKLIIHIDDIRADDLIRLRPYKSIDGLTKISGIGAARLNDIKTQGVACVK